jgi:erythromycin esterase-like protein
VERALHETGLGGTFAVPLRGSDAADRAREALERAPLLERAIGVIYRPRTERVSHYFQAWVGRQFDFLYHVDRSRAVTPLDRAGGGWAEEEAAAAAEVPETYPTGL